MDARISTSCRACVDTDACWKAVINQYFTFRLVLEKQEKFDGHQQFFAIVQLIGTRKQAENFAYRLVFCWDLEVEAVLTSLYGHCSHQGYS